jgi:hypothetical protein
VTAVLALLLVVTIAAVGGAARRWTRALGARGLELVVAAAPLAAAVAGVHPLGPARLARDRPAAAVRLPPGDYAVPGELLVAWLAGIARAPGPALLWVAATALQAALSGWVGLRRLGGDRLMSGLAIAAVLLTPLAASQWTGPHTDLPALAWLWTAGDAEARRRVQHCVTRNPSISRLSCRAGRIGAP